MGTLVFVANPELGHILPILKPAIELQRAGHRAVVCTLPDFAQVVVDAGLEFWPIGDRGSWNWAEAWNKLFRAKGRRRIGAIRDHLRLIRSFFDQSVSAIASDSVDACFIDRELSWVALECRRLGIEAVYYSVVFPEDTEAISGSRLIASNYPPTIRQLTRIHLKTLGHSVRKKAHAAVGLSVLQELDDLTRNLAARVDYAQEDIVSINVHEALQFCGPRLTTFPVVVLCPSSLDLPRACPHEWVFAGPTVDLSRAQGKWRAPKELRDTDSLVYCACGSQLWKYSNRNAFLESLSKAVSRIENAHLLFDAGPRPEMFSECELSARTTLASHPSPLDVLKRANLMITVGGLGTIKECVLNSVPMVVLPSIHDQPANAARVVHHCLGVVSTMTASPKEFEEVIRKAMGDQRIRQQLALFSDILVRAEMESPASRLLLESAGVRGLELANDAS